MSRNTTKSLVALVAVLLVVVLSGASIFYAKYVANFEDEFLFFACPYTIAFSTLDAEGTLRIYNRRMAEAPGANTEFDGVTITSVYKLPCGLPDRAVDPAGEISAWTDADAKSSIKEVIVVDDIAPQGTTAGWFSGFTNCDSMDLTKLDTSNVTDMTGMFEGCAVLTELDMSSFVTAEAGDVSCARMFAGCNLLETLYVSLFWDPEKVAETTDMFTDCTALVGAAATKYNASNTDNTYACIDGVNGSGYFTYGGSCVTQVLLMCKLDGVTASLADGESADDLQGANVWQNGPTTPVVLLPDQENVISLTGTINATQLTAYVDQARGYIVTIPGIANNTITIPKNLCGTSELGKMIYLDTDIPSGYVQKTPPDDLSGDLDYLENGGGYYYDFDSVFPADSAAWTSFY